MRTFWDDLRFTLRLARRRPLFASATLVSIVLAVCATTAVFSVVDGLLLRPLPLPEPDRLVRVAGLDSSFPEGDWLGVSAPNAGDIAARSRALESLALYNPNSNGTLLVEGEPRWVRYAVVGHEMARVLRLRPALGRWFLPAEHRPGSDGVVVLTDEGWRRELGGDPGVLGRTLLVDDVPRTVVGILPPTSLEFPKEDLVFWVPLALATSGPAAWRSGREVPWLAAVGRLRPSVPIERANAELATLGRQLAAEHPIANGTRSFRADPLQDVVVGALSGTVWLLGAAVACVLLVACGNVAMLLLATAQARRGEFAVRAALGATGGRVARQVLAEAAALAAGGGLIGLALAPAAVSAFLAIYPQPLPGRAQIVFDARVLGVAVGTMMLAALLTALPAARQAHGRASIQAAPETGRTPGARIERSGRTLIAAQVALSVVLLFAAGVLLRSFWKLRQTDLGFQPRGVLTFLLTTGDGAESERFFRELTERLGALPGVREVATSYDIPTAGRSFSDSVLREGKDDGPDNAPGAGMQMVSPRFFASLGIPLRAGRDLQASDRAGAPYVAVVNESFAARLFPGEPVLGRRVTAWGEPHTIVGVVGDARRAAPLWAPAEPEMYFSADQRGQGWRYVLVGTGSEREARALVPAIRAEVRRLAPRLPLAELSTLEERLRDATAPQRFHGSLVFVVGALALVLSVVGIHGVVAYSVGRRQREIGIRVALGEDRAAVRWRVLAQALWPAGAGVAGGLAAAWGASRWLSGFVHGVSARDAPTMLAVAVLFLVVAALAAYLPARRASRLDPISALRAP